jgi:hypothetical protein
MLTLTKFKNAVEESQCQKGQNQVSNLQHFIIFTEATNCRCPESHLAGLGGYISKPRGRIILRWILEE